MERWAGKIAVVTGSSSGIGWAITKDLLASGMIVVGMARRLQEMEQLHTQLKGQQRDNFFPHECDLSSLSSLKTAFYWIRQRFQRLHVLVNTAGMAEISKLLDEGNEDSLRRVIDVNLMGTVFCTKQAYALMKVAMEGGEECHIVTVNSLLGHTVPINVPDCGLNLYPVAKHALRSTHEVLRRELYPHKLMRLSSISPGLTRTSFASNTESHGNSVEKLLEPDEILQAEDVAQGVHFILSSPLHCTVAELVMVPTQERY